MLLNVWLVIFKGNTLLKMEVVAVRRDISSRMRMTTVLRYVEMAVDSILLVMMEIILIRTDALPNVKSKGIINVLEETRLILPYALS